MNGIGDRQEWREVVEVLKRQDSSSDPLDELNEALRDVEDAIGSKFGVQATVPMGNESLMWAKRGPIWALFVVDAGGAEHPLLGASADRRLKAAETLQALLTALHIARSERNNACWRASGLVRKLTAEVRSIKWATDTSGGTKEGSDE